MSKCEANLMFVQHKRARKNEKIKRTFLLFLLHSLFVILSLSLLSVVLRLYMLKIEITEKKKRGRRKEKEEEEDSWCGHITEKEHIHFIQDAEIRDMQTRRDARSLACSLSPASTATASRKACNKENECHT
jgi:cell division protein FtsL